MAKKSLGYVHLVWRCPQCESKVLGPVKLCPSCGYPQPDNVEFEQAAEETLITDEAEIERIQIGADIHCFYCGTRNVADAATCSQCGANLSEGEARDTGDVLGAHRDKPAEPIACPSCSTDNDPDATMCVQCGASLPQTIREPAERRAKLETQPAVKGISRFALIGVGLILCAVIGGFIYLFNRTEATTGTVSAIRWQREIVIEGLVPVEYETWHDEIPAQSILGSCTQKVRRTQDNPEPGAIEVCGTAYTRDTGTGHGEVVQDCRYQVLADWCAYIVEEWREVDTVSTNGDDFNPHWPVLRLGPKQREGVRDETFQCIFSTADGSEIYSTSNFNEYQQCQIGSQWTLQVNTFGMVLEIEPMR